MKRLTGRVAVVLLLLPITHLMMADEGMGQDLDVRPGDRVVAQLTEPDTEPLEGWVTDLREGGFAMRLRGARSGEAPLRVDLADVSSLQRARRLGGHARRGALYGGVGLAGAGYAMVCLLASSSGDDGCSGDEGNALKVALILGVPGALLGAAIGSLIGNYGPLESVEVERIARLPDADGFRVQVMPGEAGGVSVRFVLAVGGGG